MDEVISENNNQVDPGFNYDINADEFDIFNDSVNEKFLKNSWAKITGDVDEYGNTVYKLRTINRLINHIDFTHEKEEKFKILKKAKLEIYLIKYSDTLFKNSPLKRNDAFEIGTSRGGVKIYADGFRIFGYSDSGNDWLNLTKDRSRSLVNFRDESSKLESEDKRPGLQLFDYRNMFGYVNYEKKFNSGLSISINRESIDNTPNFEELTQFVRLAINIATVIYSDERFKGERIAIEKKQAEEKRVLEKAIQAQKALEEEKAVAKLKEEKIKEKRKQLEIEAKNRKDELLKIQKERELAYLEKEKAEKKRKEVEKKHVSKILGNYG